MAHRRPSALRPSAPSSTAGRPTEARDGPCRAAPFGPSSRRRIRASLRILASAAVLAVVVVAPLPGDHTAGDAPAGAAPAAPAAGTSGPCPGGRGVTVVVDFQALGGGVNVRCAPGPVGTGFEALSAAGFGFDVAVRAPGFLCRIAGKPASDPCIDTSPASAYWSYWVADRDGPWCYSDMGAGSRTPPEGTVEGWSFATGGGVGDAPPPRSGTFTRLPGDQRLPRSECVRPAAAPSPTAAAPPARAPAPAAASPAAPPTAAPPVAPPTPGDPAPAASPGGGVVAPPPAGPGGGTGAASASGADREGAAGAPDAEPGAPPAGTSDAGGDATDGGTAEALAEAEAPRGDAATGDRAAPDVSEGEGTDGDEEALTAEELATGTTEGQGSPWPTLVGVAVVAVLGAGAVMVSRRRFGAAGAGGGAVGAAAAPDEPAPPTHT